MDSEAPFDLNNPEMLSRAEIQRLRSLREKKHRESFGLFAVEGEKTVSELLAAGYLFESIHATADWAGGGKSLSDVRLVSADEMARISHFPSPSPVFAVGRIRREPLEPEALNRGLTLALDGVQDAGNVGTAIRVADWFGLDRVVCSGDCADLFSPKVIQSSMGSFSRMRLHSADLAVCLAGLTVPVLGCDLQGESVHGVGPLRDAVIVVGNEGRGLSPPVKKLVTRLITIPRIGHAESLNAAIAAAIVCDNLRRAAR